MKEQIHVIDKRKVSNKELKQILLENKNIKFVSLMGVDLGGNATDEKIPVSLLLDDVDDFLKSAIQTDGSSVELHNIATLNNAKVDLMPDQDCKWYIDYNLENIDPETGLAVGTLKIPALLIHDNKRVGSRGILRKAQSNFKKSLIGIFEEYPKIINSIGVDSVNDIEDIVLTSATELEFWVNTPEDKADLEQLSVSQSLKEQYWKRTHGIIRTCLEQSLEKLEKMGYSVPEDISVTGFDNYPFIRRNASGLTTVDVDIAMMASEGVELLLERLNDKRETFVRRVVSGHIVIRKSTGKAATEP